MLERLTRRAVADRWRAFVVLAVVVESIAPGCGDDGSIRQVDLRESVDRTVAAGSADFRWAWYVASAIVAKAEGQADFRRQSGTLRLSSERSPQTPVSESVLVNGTLFSREVAQNGQWVAWQRGESGAAAFLGLRDGIPEVVPRLTDNVTSDGFREALSELLGRASEYEYVGRTTVAGESVNHFRRPGPPSVADVGARATDVYLDSEGRLRRVDYPDPDPASHRAAPHHFTLEFVAFGTVKAEITPPAVP